MGDYYEKKDTRRSAAASIFLYLLLYICFAFINQHGGLFQLRVKTAGFLYYILHSYSTIRHPIRLSYIYISREKNYRLFQYI